MENIHKDAKHNIVTYFVHGFTARTKLQQEMLRKDAKRCQSPQNIHVEGVYLKDPYGTHHSKVMVLMFEDEQESVQIIVHTANLISFDWGNMTQGVWRSPKLIKEDSTVPSSRKENGFKHDFLAYIDQYKLKCTTNLSNLLRQYDFSIIEGVEFIASTPGYYNSDTPSYHQWGIGKLQYEIQKINQKTQEEQDGINDIIIQVSSIASLGNTEQYLNQIMFNALRGKKFFSGSDANGKHSNHLNIIFPTVKNISESLYGYGSGGSIHFKRQTDSQKRQLQYLRPYLRQWKAVDAGRDRAAPHIKTYMKISRKSKSIAWFLLTSANLSKQAWGTVNAKTGAIWIQSWECGVLVQPKLPGEIIKPCYKQDSINMSGSSDPQAQSTVSLRMPYDYPLTGYGSSDMIWSSHETYTISDWRGEKWPPEDD